MFARGTSEDILQIKLGNLSSRDKLVWKENKAKVFSVKTAYQVALWLHHPHVGEHSLATMDQKIWKRIWSINVPPKVGTFVWRACFYILPTKTNLFHKKVPVDPLCSVFGQADETTVHILWECPLAHNVWALVWGRIQKKKKKTPWRQASFFSHGKWWRHYPRRSLRRGPCWRGHFGMHVIRYTLESHNPIPQRFLNRKRSNGGSIRNWLRTLYTSSGPETLISFLGLVFFFFYFLYFVFFLLCLPGSS